MNNSTRNGNIEILRFFMCVMVVLFHADISVHNVNIGGGGFLAVEFFFMITGYFLAQKLKPVEGNYVSHRSILEICNESWVNIKKRIEEVYPVFIMSFLVSALLEVIGNDQSLTHDMLLLTLSPFTCLFLISFGYPTTGHMLVSWYLSSLFFAQWLLYPFVRIYYNIYVKYIAPVICILIVGTYASYFGTLDVTSAEIGFIRGGCLRAIVMISMGMVVYELSCKLREIHFTVTGIRLLTITEIFMWMAVFAGMFFLPDGLSQNWELLILFMMIMALIVTLCRKSRLYGRLNYGVVMFVGRLSKTWFLNHLAWLHFWPSITRRIGIELSYAQNIILAFLLSFFTSLIIMRFTEKLRFFTCMAKRLIVCKQD